MPKDTLTDPLALSREQLLIGPVIYKKFTDVLLHPGMHTHIRQMSDVQQEAAYMRFSSPAC